MRRLLAFILAVPLVGCVIKPQGASREPERLDAVGREFGYSTARVLAARSEAPELPSLPKWNDVLERAFRANGDLEASFHEWVMAVERIDQAGTWPTSNVELGFEYMFSSERMKSFDRMTFSAGLMDASALPNKTYANATVAWREAQAAAERFRSAKFDLQMRVLQAWADYVLQAERVRVQEENRDLLRLVSETAASRVRAGGAQQEQLRADVELRLAENELQSARATLDQQRATLNAMLRRTPDATLTPPVSLPKPRILAGDDESLLAAGVANNADLAALGSDVEARRAAIRRAKLEYLPEINPMAAFTGSVSQSLGAAITVPTQLPRIRAMVAESRADLRRVEASLQQAKADRAGQFAVTLLAIRDAERRAQQFEQDILPLLSETVELTRRSYGAGTATYLDLIDTQRTRLDVRLMAAEAWAMRERMLAELESLGGVDVEMIAATPTSAPQKSSKESR
jgi:outer membrane protein TolC